MLKKITLISPKETTDHADKNHNLMLDMRGKETYIGYTSEIQKST